MSAKNGVYLRLERRTWDVNSKDTDQTLDMDTSALWRIVVTTLLDFCSNYYIHGHYCRIIEFVYNYFHVSLVIN